MKQYFGIFAAILLLAGCNDTIPEDEGGQSGTSSSNIWIYKQMKNYYLWSDEMPAESNGYFSYSPEIYFESLLYKRGQVLGDRFSYITSTSTSSKATAPDTPDAADTYVTDFGFYGRIANVVNNSSGINFSAYQILYVIPDSPADVKGIMRGDLFRKINGQQVSTNNISTYLGYSDITLTQCDYSGNTSGTVQISKGSYANNPLIAAMMIGVGNYNIAYMAYNHFSFGKNYVFTEILKECFKFFKENEANELVLDLRFNPGGYINVAALLATMIVGRDHTDNGDVLCYQEYNTTYGNYLKGVLGSTYDQTPFGSSMLSSEEMDECCLDLDRVHIITQSRTASASELVLHALKPYIEVIQYGQTTSGKNLGAVNISGESSNVPWEINPIVSRVSDRNRLSGYESGISPSARLTASDLGMGDLGDLNNENLLNLVWANIDGRVPASVFSEGEEFTIETLYEPSLKGGGIILENL